MTNRTLLIVLTVTSLIFLACAGGSSNVSDQSRTNLDEQPMPGGQFMQLLEELNTIELPEERLARIDQAARTNHFLASQIRDMINVFDHTDDRLRALELTSSQLVDLDNTYSTIIYNLPEEERAHAQAILNATGAEREAIIAERERQEEEERRIRREEQRARMQEEMARQQERRDQQRQEQASQPGAAGGGGGGGGSSQTCCLNGQFFECPSAAAVAKCVPPRFVQCISETMDVFTCSEKYPPDPSDCNRTPARDNEC